MSRIQYLSHNQIDKQLWDACIRDASNGLIYAESAFLDAMSLGWDALVLDDYSAVMPVTWRMKWGMKYVCQPAFCQQLGVFYGDEKYKENVGDFLRVLADKIKLVEINLNYDNMQPNSVLLNNFILSLKPDYASLHAALSPRFIQSLKRGSRYPMRYETDKDPTEIIEAYQLSYSNRMHIRPQDFMYFKAYCKMLQAEQRLIIRSARHPDGTLLAATILLKDEKRLYNVINVITGNGRTLEANYFLYDNLLKEFASSDLLLDFEGSDLPGVALFYQKFRPINQPYTSFKSNRLPAVLKWLKR